MLLRPVVQVTLDPAAGLVGGRDDTTARGLELRGLSPDLVERGLERGVELRVVHHHPELPGELHEHPLLLRRERPVLDRSLDHHDAQELARVRHGGHPHVRIAVLQHLRHPHLHPPVAAETRLHDVHGIHPTQRDRSPTDIRIADPRPELIVEQQPDLGRLQPHRRSESLSSLQHEFIQRHGPRHARGERSCELLRNAEIAAGRAPDRCADPRTEHGHEARREGDRADGCRDDPALSAGGNAPQQQEQHREGDDHHDREGERPQQDAERLPQPAPVHRVIPPSGPWRAACVVRPARARARRPEPRSARRGSPAGSAARGPDRARCRVCRRRPTMPGVR